MKVSRRHASIMWDGTAYAIDNVSGTDTLLVNGQPVKNTILNDSDETFDYFLVSYQRLL